MAVDALAQVHARCWDDEPVRAGFTDRPDAEWHTGLASAQFVDWVEETLPRFLIDVGNRVSGRRIALYRTIAARLPTRLLERQSAGTNLTLTQGDTHAGNFLYPRDPTTNGPYIVDWKRASIALGAGDLAYMMALYWFPDIRATWERPLLERYYGRLVEQDVARYTWPDLWDDYRLSVLKQFFEAVWGWSVGQNTLIWWNHLERITRAIEDLNCPDML
jgi:thiamine kinase-like enzyme